MEPSNWFILVELNMGSDFQGNGQSLGKIIKNCSGCPEAMAEMRREPSKRS